MALRAPLIQSKRAHSLSTGALLAIAFSVLAAGGCAGGETHTTPAGGAVLKPDLMTIRVGPGETGFARVVMTSGGVPVGSATVTFSINNAPLVPDTHEPGAMLAAATAVTDASGAATVGISVDPGVALASVFSIQATAASGRADVTVIVADPSSGSVVVAPFFPNPDTPKRATGGIILRFLDGQRCAEVDPYLPPDAQGGGRPKVDKVTGETATFEYVTTTRPAAALGRANDEHGELIALGCIDLPEGTVQPDGVVAVALPLRDAVPSPVGRFGVISKIAFRPPPPAAASIAGPWRDLSDCPLDPAQLLLDCIIDALSPETAADPLDCSPNLALGGEGPLGDALMARRGLLIANAAGAVTSCRAGQDRLGGPSLDAIALGLFGTPTPPLLVTMPAIAVDAAHILDSVELGSTLDVQATGRPDEFIVTHRLDSATFGPLMPSAPRVTVALAPLALPALTATTTATTRDGLLIVDDHGFSLRLGRVALVGFNAAALATRLPAQATADTDGLITEVVKLAHAKDADGSDVTGCAAFNALLCPIAGGDQTCLSAACSDGLGALIARLRGGFNAANGSGLDFYLAGSAPVLNTQGGASAHQLGMDGTAPARWSVDLQTAAGRSQLSTTFVGLRE